MASSCTQMTSSKLTRRASRSNDIPNSERPPLPRQVRCLVFSSEEIFSALVEHRRRRKLPLPSGYVEKIDMETGEAGTFAYLRICCDADRQTIEVEFNNAEIQEALITRTSGFQRSLRRSFHGGGALEPKREVVGEDFAKE